MLTLMDLKSETRMWTHLSNIQKKSEVDRKYVVVCAHTNTHTHTCAHTHTHLKAHARV